VRIKNWEKRRKNNSKHQKKVEIKETLRIKRVCKNAWDAWG